MTIQHTKMGEFFTAKVISRFKISRHFEVRSFVVTFWEKEFGIFAVSRNHQQGLLRELFVVSQNRNLLLINIKVTVDLQG